MEFRVIRDHSEFKALQSQWDSLYNLSGSIYGLRILPNMRTGSLLLSKKTEH